MQESGSGAEQLLNYHVCYRKHEEIDFLLIGGAQDRSI